MADPPGADSTGERPAAGPSARALEVLLGALDHDPEERAAFVAAACGPDRALADEVFTLIRADEAAGRLDRSALEIAAQELLSAQAEPGLVLGHHRLSKEIGRGGMSRVFLAERVDGDFEQTVAIKVLLPFSVEPAEQERRFTAERRILATLQHPGIARLFDGGVAPGGQPYLVMEHVDGRPITDHCRAERLGLEDRLRLFRQVCDAVAAAHRRLIVHRDLKPSNVLVDRGGQVKLLDFGIAKAIAPEGAAWTPHTRTGLLLMTPEYAAPEQLRGEPVGTATDVHGLGLLLFEMLTGRRPFDTAGLRPTQIETLVCETDAPPPSSRLAGGGPFASDRLRGDVDAIVEKALRKEPEARYGAAADLRDDIDRYLAGRPILARPPSLGYVLGKAARRHRWPLLAAAGVVVAGALGLASTLHQAGEAARQRDAALRESENARIEATRARRVTDFTLELFDAANPKHGADVTVRQVLQEGALRLDDLDEEPLVQAEMLAVIGNAFLRLGDFGEAEGIFRRLIALHESSGPPTVALANAVAGLGAALEGAGERPEEARAALERAVALDAELLSDDGRAAAVAHLRELAKFELRWGTLDRSEALVAQALAEARQLGLGEEIPQLLGLTGTLHVRRERFAEAADFFSEALEHWQRSHGRDHPSVATMLHNLGFAALRRHELEPAVGYLEQAAEIKRRILPPDHTSTAATIWVLGDALVRLGRLDEAEERLLEARAIRVASLGPVHPELVPIDFHLGQLERARGRLEAAERHYRTAIADAEPTLGLHGYRQARTWEVLGDVLVEMGRAADAAEAFGHAAKSYEVSDREDRTIAPLLRQAEALRDAGRLAEALGASETARARAATHLEPADELHRRIEALSRSLAR